MISQTLLFILGGCLLGAIQLLAGIVIGLWLRGAEGADSDRQDIVRASAIAQRLQALADEMSRGVGEHRSQLDQASKLLMCEDVRSGESLAELVLDVVGDIVQANQKLQVKLERAENRLEQQASEIEAHISRSLTDSLTGLPNRREFNARLEERMAAWKRRREVFSLLLLDVDHFKKLNDERGHLAGDQVLAAIGPALRAAVRRDDVVARYGGEEFAILLPSTSLDQAVCVAEKIRKTVSQVVVNHNGQQIAITISGGLSAIVANESDESLIERADAGLYSAKAAGRNCTFIHDGVECRAADEFQRQLTQSLAAAQPSQPTDPPVLEELPVEEPSGEQECDVGSHLAREPISRELAETCEELRRYVREREQSPQQAASAFPS